MKKIIFSLLIITVSFPTFTIKAETYFKVDITAGNIWLEVLNIMATYGINKSKGEFVVDNYWALSAFSTDVDPYANNTLIMSNSDGDIETWYTYKFPDLINGLGTGVKWGIQNNYESFVESCALYGSIHTVYNYFVKDVRKIGESSEKFENSVVRLSPGIGANVCFGGYSSPLSILLDVNLRYDIPVIYHGGFGHGAGCLNTGLSPHISVIAGGPHLKKIGMNIGLFFEWTTYNLFKPSEYFIEPYKAKGYTFGINFTMFPWK